MSSNENDSSSTPPTTPASNAPQTSEASNQPRRNLKIGTQREGDDAAQARPKPPPLPPPPIDTGAVLEGTTAPPEGSKEGPQMKRPRRRREEGEDSGPRQANLDEPRYNFAPPPPKPSRQIAPELQAEIDEALAGVTLDDLMAARPQAEADLELESRHRATVANISDEFVFFQIGTNHQGVIGKRQFKTVPEIGASMDVVVAKFLADEGLYEVHVPGAAAHVADWSDLSEGVVVEANVTGTNKGGLEVEVKKIRGFIPAGQISIYRVESFDDYVGQKLLCVVTEANAEKRNLVLSRRSILEREKAEARQKVLAELAPGQIRDGVVTKIQDFGAFVDIGGLEGLVHVSKLGWDRIKHPSEVLTEGQKIRVKVEKIDPDSGKLSLSYRDTTANPWDEVGTKFPIGSTVKGTVSRIAKYGAFVKLAPGVEGLVHISEIAHHRVIRIENTVKEGQEVEVKVLTFDRQAQKLGLSIKGVTAAAAAKAADEAAKEEKDEPLRKAAVKPTNKPLQGGTNKASGGEKFGLNW